MAVDLRPNLYAHWKLNEASGALVSDSSVNGRNGTTVNMEDADWVAGKLNNCLQFDGVNEYVNCGVIAGFEKNEPFTLEFWIKFNVAADMVILSKAVGNPLTRGYYIQTYNGKLMLMMRSSIGSEIQLATTSTYDDNTWKHVVCTYDGSSNGNNIKIYVNSVVQGMTVLSNDLTGTIINGATFEISGINTNYCFNGQIDEVVIYDKELSQEEVTFRWNSGAGTEDMSDIALDPPTAPSNPDPFDTAIDIDYNQNLDWDCPDADTYDIYLGTSSPPLVVESAHPSSDYTIPFNLDSCTTYYWKIVAKNDAGETASDIWSFTTNNALPIIPNTPSPTHYSTEQNTTLILSWVCEDYNPNDTLVYDIYFGTAPDPPLKKSNHPDREYSISGLDENKDYYWKIVARDDATCETHETISPIWKFTTREELLGGYKSYDPRETIREYIGKVKYRIGNSEEEYWVLEIKNKLTDDIEIPLYYSEEVKSGSIKEMPFIDMNLMQVEYAPHDIGAATRRHKCWLDVGLWYADTDNVDRHDFGKKIVDKIIDKIRSIQCEMYHIDFINVESVRLLREEAAHQVIYHYVITIYCIFYDLGTSSY